MPAVTQVILYDDQAWPEHVPAEEVVRVTLHWQAVDGDGRSQESSELYLTTAGRQQLQGDLKHWHQIGHRPGTRGSPAPAAGERTKGMRAGPATTPGSTDRRRWKERLREWSDGLGLRNRQDPAFPAWQTTTGKHYYPADLEDAFTLHEQGQEAEALAKVAAFRQAAA